MQATFDVSVNLPFRVQILQALQNLPQYGSNVGLFKWAWAELNKEQINWAQLHFLENSMSSRKCKSPYQI